MKYMKKMGIMMILGKSIFGEYIKRQGKEYMEDKEKKRLETKRRLLAEKILEVNKRRQEILKTRKILNHKMRELDKENEILNNEVLKIDASNK